MDRRVLDLYDQYVHGDMPRREFFRRVSVIAGSAAAASAWIATFEPDYAWGQQVASDDERLEQTKVTYEGSTGPVSGTLVLPRGAEGRLPGILVIHENRGLNAHIEDVARRAALEGFVALAPDGLSYVGGAPADQEAARDTFRNADRETITRDVLAAVPYLSAREDCTGRVGTVGFCYGGGVALRGAVEQPAVAAAVCFYGRALDVEQTAQLDVPVMMHYAGRDERINAGIADFRTALDVNEVAYSLHMYPGTGHGFHNDSSQSRYDAEAAGLAWRRTMDFFAHTLSA